VIVKKLMLEKAVEKRRIIEGSKSFRIYLSKKTRILIPKKQN